MISIYETFLAEGPRPLLQGFGPNCGDGTATPFAPAEPGHPGRTGGKEKGKPHYDDRHGGVSGEGRIWGWGNRVKTTAVAWQQRSCCRGPSGRM